MIKVEKRKIYWFFIYPFGALIFFVLSALFILSASGFSLHFEDNTLKFDKTGMLIVGSKPSGATILLEKKESARKTTAFFTVKIDKLKKGKYTLRLEKDGYHGWEKEVTIFPETVTWANYVLLFSKTPKVEKTDFPGSIKEVVTSKDDKTSLFLTRTAESEMLTLMQNSSGEKTLLLETAKLPEDRRFSDIKIIEWSKDRRYLLMSATLTGARKNFVFNTESKGIDDIGTISPIVFDRTKFNPLNSEELFVLAKGELFKINLRTRTISQALERNIVYFTFSSEGKIYFIVSNGENRSLWVASTELNGRTNLSETIPVSEEYEAKISSKNQRIALFLKNGSTLFLVAKINEKNSLISIGKEVTDYEWSKDGERLMYKEKGKNIIVLEDDTYRKETVEYESEKTEAFENISWYDSRHLLSRQDKKVVIMDFDGTNKVELGDTLMGTSPFHSEDNGDICFNVPQEKENQSLIARYKVEF